MSPSSSESLSRGTYFLDVLALAAERCASEVSSAFPGSNECVDTIVWITNDTHTSTIAFPFVVENMRVDSLTHGHTQVRLRDVAVLLLDTLQFAVCNTM